MRIGERYQPNLNGLAGLEWHAQLLEHIDATVQQRGYLPRDRSRIGARREPDIAIAIGTKPVFLEILGDTVGRRCMRHDRLGPYMSVVW